MTDDALPPDFLSRPLGDVTAEIVDFTKTSVPEYANLYACIIDNALSAEECHTLIDAIESRHEGEEWERAMINIGMGFTALYEDERKCGRFIWDNKTLATKIWRRIENLPEVQEILRLESRPRVTGLGPMKRGEVWRLSRPNEQLRFLKYVGGEYFRMHCDARYQTPDKKEESMFTLHLYLNDAIPAPEVDTIAKERNERNGRDGRSDGRREDALIGGATTFNALDAKRRYDVYPKAGRILLFQQRDLVHAGDDVLQGVKYTMRTDMKYTIESTSGN
jgi:hypothetical protein